MASMRRSTYPWIFGSFAIYARTVRAAQQVYQCVKDSAGSIEPFGIVSTETGEKITRVNTCYIPMDVPPITSL